MNVNYLYIINYYVTIARITFCVNEVDNIYFV